MSDLARYANLKGVDVRTVQRWCQGGKIPAQRKGKRWRIEEKFLSGMIARDGALRCFRAWFGNGNGDRPLTARDKRALEYTVLKRKIRNKEALERFLCHHYRPDPEAYDAVSRPYGDVLIAAAWLHQFGTLNVNTLARKIGVSVPTLYRLQPGIMKIIRQRLATFDPAAPTERRPAKPKPERH
jgi:hypothetical protein